MDEHEARSLATHTQRLHPTTPTGYLTASECPAGNGWHVTRTVPPPSDEDPGDGAELR